MSALEAGAEPTSDEYKDALDFLNDLLSGSDGLMLYYFSREEFTLTIGQKEYTIGSGGNFNTARPVSIDSAQVSSGGVDWDVDIIPQNRYDGHALKTTQGRPYQAFYIPEYPLGKIELFFVPDLAYTLRLNMKKRLGGYTSINDDITLPDEYHRALVFNLAVEIANAWGFEVPSGVRQIAKETRDTIKRINLSNNIDDAELDDALKYTTHRSAGRRFFHGG